MENELAAINQYLTFTLAEEQYALEIVKVLEVLDYSSVTHVPRMPAFLKGVINLRGNVVPVVDLRLCLGLPPVEVTVDTCIVIVELSFDGEDASVGMLADSVQEVVDIDPSQTRPPAKLGSKLPTEFIKGMGIKDKDGGFLIIIDIDRVLSSQEVEVIDSVLDEVVM